MARSIGLSKESIIEERDSGVVNGPACGGIEDEEGNGGIDFGADVVSRGRSRKGSRDFRNVV